METIVEGMGLEPSSKTLEAAAVKEVDDDGDDEHLDAIDARTFRKLVGVESQNHQHGLHLGWRRQPIRKIVAADTPI